MNYTNHKNWMVYQSDQDQISSLARELHVSPSVASVYLARGIDSDAEYLFHCEGEFQFPAFLLPDIHHAVDRIVHAISSRETILVHGDGDADGVCSAALVLHGLQPFTDNVLCRIPSRLTDGFGLSLTAVETAKSNGVSLVITTDCGTEAIAAAHRCKELGIDLIVTDHHSIRADGQLPKCHALVNAKRHDSIYPNRDLAGVGVAYKLMHLLWERLNAGTDELDQMAMPLVALGTVADCVSLTDENRTFVKTGLAQITKSPMPGMNALIKASGVRTIDTEAVNFFLAPCINAACRLGQPDVAMRLLTANSKIEANALADQLCKLNSERQEITRMLFHLAYRSLPESLADYPVLFASGLSWHRGVIGLVAGKLTNEYQKPSFVCSINTDDGIAHGSCRSILGFNILEALDSCADLLIKHGGHAQAAGFSLYPNNLGQFEARLYEYADSVNSDSIDRSLYIDAEIPLAQLNLKTYEALERLAPFGQGNPRPILATTGLTVAGAAAFGKSATHLKLLLTDENRKTTIPAVWWGHGANFCGFATRSKLDVAYNLVLDTYQAKPTITLNVEDARSQ